MPVSSEVTGFGSQPITYWYMEYVSQLDCFSFSGAVKRIIHNFEIHRGNSINHVQTEMFVLSDLSFLSLILETVVTIC
jgi:hypothetical protein